MNTRPHSRLVRPLLSVLALLTLAAASAAQRARPDADWLPWPKGDRTLLLATLPAENEDYFDSFVLAKGLGAEGVGLPFAWDDIEIAPFVYDLSMLQVANDFYPLFGSPVALGLNPIDTNHLRVPADLAGLPFDHPYVIQRYLSMLDAAFSAIPNLDLTSVSIGNEVDVYLGTDSARWQQYASFFAVTSAWVRVRRPGVPVGCKATREGLLGAAECEMRAVNAAADVVMVTYYPLYPDATVRPPHVVHGDFRAIVEAYPYDPIYMMEVGYPSGPLCNSNEFLQAMFIEEMFHAWDKFGSHIKLVNYIALTDFSPEMIDFFEQYYGISDPAFLEFLGTLGLRQWDGTPKIGLYQFYVEARGRGWIW